MVPAWLFLPDDRGMIIVSLAFVLLHTRVHTTPAFENRTSRKTHKLTGVHPTFTLVKEKYCMLVKGRVTQGKNKKTNDEKKRKWIN